MVDIISKRDGPRREDVKAKRLIAENRDTIRKLADTFTSGAYSASRQPKPAPSAKGLIIHDCGGAQKSETPQPYIRISPNGRVVMVDYETGRQMHHLGEIRRRDNSTRFCLATQENGFFSPLDAELATLLADIDAKAMTSTYGERQLIADINSRLGIE